MLIERLQKGVESFRKGYSKGVDRYGDLLTHYERREEGSFLEREAYNLGNGLAYFFPTVSIPINIYRKLKSKA